MDKPCFKFSEKLDHAFLESLYEDDLEHAEMVFTQYIEQAPVQMLAIETAYNNGSVAVFRQLLHKIKPVFSYVGLTAITQQAEDIERHCEAIGHMSEVKQLYTNFKKAVGACHTEIENQLDIIKQQIK